MASERIEVRRARKDDIPFVLRMWSFILGDLVKGHPHFRPSYRATSGLGPHMARLLDEPDSLLLVAHQGARRVGFLNASVVQRPLAARDDRIGLVENVYVDPAWRGEGIADRLMDEVMRWLEGKGVQLVEAVTEANNHRALGFFGKFGFDILTLTLVRPLRASSDRRTTSRRSGSLRTPRRGTARGRQSVSARR